MFSQKKTENQQKLFVGNEPKHKERKRKKTEGSGNPNSSVFFTNKVDQ